MGDEVGWKYDVAAVVEEIVLSPSMIPSPCYGLIEKSEVRGNRQQTRDAVISKEYFGYWRERWRN